MRDAFFSLPVIWILSAWAGRCYRKRIGSTLPLPRSMGGWMMNCDGRCVYPRSPQRMYEPFQAFDLPEPSTPKVTAKPPLSRPRRCS